MTPLPAVDCRQWNKHSVISVMVQLRRKIVRIWLLNISCLVAPHSGLAFWTTGHCFTECRAFWVNCQLWMNLYTSREFHQTKLWKQKFVEVAPTIRFRIHSRSPSGNFSLVTVGPYSSRPINCILDSLTQNWGSLYFGLLWRKKMD